MEDDEAHGLLLPFDTDDQEFARGFEVGRIWAMLRATPNEQEFLVHTSNAEMVLRIGEVLGRRVRGEESTDGHWTTLIFDAADE